MQAAAPRHGRHASASGPISFEVGRVSSSSSSRAASCRARSPAGQVSRVAEAEQQIDVGGPGADAVHRGQRRMGFVGRLGSERGKVELAAIDRFRDRLERADFRCRQAGAGEPGRTRAQHRRMIERIEGQR